MVGFFRRRFGRLPRLLASYPPYLTPHPGDARLLSLAQCRENLQYLLDVREQRLQLAAELLGHFGIDLRAGPEAEDPREFLAALDQWARTEWPTAYRPSLAGTPLEWVALPDRLWRHSMTAVWMCRLPLYDPRRRGIVRLYGGGVGTDRARCCDQERVGMGYRDVRVSSPSC